MIELTAVEEALAAIVRDLTRVGKGHALVGGLAVSVRAEVRFTRDVDMAVAVADDSDAEALILLLRDGGYKAIASIEHDAVGRLSTVRLLSPHEVKVDLLFASSGIEHEIVARATDVQLGSVGTVPVACAEELLAMKVLSMTDLRLQDRIDAQQLIACNPTLDFGRVRDDLRLITERAFNRDQHLEAKLETLQSRSAPG
jgi:hypothetical protein